MKRILTIALLSFPLLSPPMLSAEEVGFRDLHRYQEYLPDYLNLVEDITVEAESGDPQKLTAGTALEIIGIQNNGIKVRVGNGSALLKPEQTDVASQLKDRAEAAGVTVRFQGKAKPRTPKVASTPPANSNPEAPKHEEVPEVAKGNLPPIPIGLLEGELTKLFPEKLLNRTGKEVPRDLLAGKFVGVYFSAHWCPPCRAFTPKLVKFRNENREEFEVVFASSDRSPEAQFDYMRGAGMEWLTLPHRGPDANRLAQKFGVRGIPMLVILSPEGKVISSNGRADIMTQGNTALDAWKKSSGIDTPAAFAKKPDAPEEPAGPDSTAAVPPEVKPVPAKPVPDDHPESQIPKEAPAWRRSFQKN